MGQDSLDRIKEIMLDHEVAIDNDQLWAAISHKKNLSRRKKIGGGIIGLSLLLSIVVLWFMNKPSNNSGQSQTIKHSSIAFENQDYLNNENKTSPELSSNEPKENQASSLLNNSSNQKFAQANNNIKYERNSFNSSASYPSLNASDKTRHKPINSSTSSISISKSNDVSSEEDRFINDAIFPDSDKLSVGPSLTRSTNSILYLERIGGLKINQLLTGSNEQKLDLRLSNEIECYQHGGKKNALFLVAYTSVDLNFKSMSTASEFSDYLDARKSTENQLLSYHAGLQLKYLLFNGLYLKGGLEYGQVRERFKHRKVTETTEILPGQIIQIDITPTGDTILVYGNAPVTTIEMKNWRVGNTYKTLDFTAMLGYQMSKGSLVYSAELGASMNTIFSFKGLILDATDNPVPANIYFRNKIGWSVLAAINLGYKMNSRVTAFTGLNFKRNLQNINASTNVIDQKYTNVGIHFGLEFKL